jgi:hypothetical protein
MSKMAGARMAAFISSMLSPSTPIEVEQLSTVGSSRMGVECAKHPDSSYLWVLLLYV